MSEKIQRDFPRCEVASLNEDFLKLSEELQLRLVRQFDLVVAATDTIECQRRINEVCLRTGITAVYPGVWTDPGTSLQDAEIGEILWVRPNQGMPCYLCFTRWRPDGGTAEARGGTGADIQVVVLATIAVITALLNPSDVRAGILDNERNLILVHGFMPTSSEAIRVLFEDTDESGLRNIRVPFPPTRCPACRGRRPRTPAAPRPLSTRFPHRTQTRSLWRNASTGAVLAVVALVIGGLVWVGNYFYHYNDSNGTAAASAPDTGCLSTGITGGTVAAMAWDQAGSTSATEYLRALRGSQVREVVYAGDSASTGELIAWLNEAECDGFMTGVLINSAFAALPTDQAKIEYIRAIDQNMNLQAYWIDANSAHQNETLDRGSPGSFEVQQWMGLIAQGGSKPVRVLGDFFDGPDEGENVARSEAYLANPYVPLFLPVGASPGYGSTDEYANAGTLTFELAGITAWGAVQAFGQDGAERPTPEQVGLFARMLSSPQQPINRILLYSEGEAAADTAYITACAEQVSQVIG